MKSKKAYKIKRTASLSENIYIHNLKNAETGNIISILKIKNKNDLEMKNIKILRKLKSEFIAKIVVKKFLILKKSIIYTNNFLFPLKYLIETSLPIPEELMCRFYYQLFKGINYIHSKNVLHLNITTDSLFVDSEYNLKIFDFSRSKSFKNVKSGDLIKVEKFKAPKELLPPQYFKKETVSGVYCDIWASIIILFTLEIKIEPWADATLRNEEYKRFTSSAAVLKRQKNANINNLFLIIFNKKRKITSQNILSNKNFLEIEKIFKKSKNYNFGKLIADYDSYFSLVSDPYLDFQAENELSNLLELNLSEKTYLNFYRYFTKNIISMDEVNKKIRLSILKFNLKIFKTPKGFYLKVIHNRELTINIKIENKVNLLIFDFELIKGENFLFAKIIYDIIDSLNLQCSIGKGLYNNVHLVC